MVNRELLQGQKLLGWALILIGLALLMLIGLAESLERSYPQSMVGAFGSWARKAEGNQTMVGVVAWLLLAGGYIFVLSARVEERLRDIGGELEDRICHLQRELVALQQRIGDRSGTDHPAGTPRARPASGADLSV
jgi:thiosulfate reductase cytochrome b subunit